MNNQLASQAYREIAAENATPVGLVILLYERLIQDIQNAASTIADKDMDARVAHLNHAFLILQQLQGTLNFDVGANVARQLDRFYDVMRAKLLEAQIRQSKDLLLEQARLAAEVKESWVEVEKKEASQAPAPAPLPVAAIPLPAEDEPAYSSAWNA
jgi:flagellar secretion chaperone FliS